MRIIWTLLFMGIILGDGLIALVVAVYLFRNRGRSRVMLTQANLFACHAVYLLLLFLSYDKLTKPVTPGFTVLTYVALTVLALGVWPAALDWLILTKQWKEPNSLTRTQSTEEEDKS